MKKKGIIAIVGRPNVGKSALFNRIIQEKKSIVEDQRGVTRDRIYGQAEWLTQEFIVIDTGGITLENAVFSQEIKVQAEIAISEADVIVFVTDYKNGLTEEDKIVARLLYKTKKPIILVVNKYDNKSIDNHNYDFLNLGLGEPIFTSAVHGIGIGDLLDKVVSFVPRIQDGTDSTIPSIAIIGKVNVGKSSLINSLTGSERMIVSNVPGTTLDSVDSLVKYHSKEFLFVDTAGIQKKSRLLENVEKYSYIRSIGAINRSDIILLMIDISKPITDQDTNIGGLAYKEKKPIIIVGNKIDLLTDKAKTVPKIEAEIRAYFKYLQYSKIIFISAKEKNKIQNIYKVIDEVNTNLKRKIQTSVFNEVLNKAQLLNSPPEFNGGRLRIYYGSQVEAYLPTFVIFVNNPCFVHFSYKRFLENQIRNNFGFEGVPINLIFRERR